MSEHNDIVLLSGNSKNDFKHVKANTGIQKIIFTAQWFYSEFD